MSSSSTSLVSTPYSSLQCFDGTGLCAAMAQDALCRVLALAGVVANLDIHRTDFKTFATFDALALIAADAQP